MNVTGRVDRLRGRLLGNNSDPGQRHPLRQRLQLLHLGRQLCILRTSPGRLRRRAHRQHHNLQPQRADPGQRQHLELGRPDQRHLQLADLRAVPGRRAAGSNNQSFQDINIIAGTMASGQSLSLVPIGHGIDGQPRLYLPGQLHGRYRSHADRRYRHQCPDRPGDHHRQRGHERHRGVDRLRGRLLGNNSDPGQRHPLRQRLQLLHLRRQLCILRTPPGRLRRRAHRQHAQPSPSTS